MLKNIAVSRLLPGMFVVNLNRGWLDHPFVKNRLRVDADDIRLILDSGIKIVTIDTQLGVDVVEYIEEEKFRSADSDQTLDDEHESAEDNASLSTSAKQKFVLLDKFEHVLDVLRSLINDVRVGSPPDIQVLENIAREITKDVLENPSVAVALYHLYHRCEYTFAHSLRVAILSVSCAYRMGHSVRECEAIALGGLIHDFGKIRVDQNILHKPSKLSFEEMEHMRLHVELGAECFRNSHLQAETAQVLLEHHERFDGSGYPHGLKGNNISLCGRISAVADVYDALASDRWYQRGLPPPAAIRKIHLMSDSQFDPRVAAEFIRAIGIYPVGSLVRLNNNRLAVVVEHKASEPLRPRVRPVFDLRRGRPLERAVEIDLSIRRHISIEALEDPLRWNINPGDYL